MRLIQAFLLLALLPVKLFAQTETPVNLTEGVLAFTCVSEKQEMTLVLLDEQSEWRLIGALEGFKVTEINNGFRFEEQERVGWLAYLQQDREDVWSLRYLSDQQSDSLACVNESDLIGQLSKAIASKVFENGELLSERNATLEQELQIAENVLVGEQSKASRLEQDLERNVNHRLELQAARNELAEERRTVSMLREELARLGGDLANTQTMLSERASEDQKLLELRRQVEAGEGGAIDVFLSELVEMDPLDRWKAMRDSPLNSAPSSLLTCLSTLRINPDRFSDECRTETVEYLLNAE